MTNRQILIANMALGAFWAAAAVGGTLIAHSIGHSLIWAALGAFLGIMGGLFATEVVRMLTQGAALRERRIDTEGRDVTDLPGLWDETDTGR